MLSCQYPPLCITYLLYFTKEPYAFRVLVVEEGDLRWVSVFTTWPVLIEHGHLREACGGDDADVPVGADLKHGHVPALRDRVPVVLEERIVLPVAVVLPVDGVATRYWPAVLALPALHEADAFALVVAPPISDKLSLILIDEILHVDHTMYH